jgi:hypothetical protein
MINIISFLLAFNLLPLDEQCIGPNRLKDHTIDAECFDWDMGVVVYDVRVG